MTYLRKVCKQVFTPRIWAFIILSLIMSLTTACRPASDKESAERMDALLSGLVSEGGPGAAVMVIRDGRVVYEGCRGVADLKTKRPIDRRTDFRLASVTKQFTAAAVMLLVRDGKLRYDDKLTDIFPDFPEYGLAISVRNLLNHTSGLVDYEDLMASVDPSVPVEQAQIKDAEVLDLMKRQTAGNFTPGSAWAYSNSGYVVLGLIVAKVSGLPFEDFLRARIFQPLKMKDSVAFVRGKNEVPRRAFGHGKDKGLWRETDQSPTSATLGDGGVYSSLADLAKWDKALRNHSLLSEAEMLPALTPVRVPAGPPIGPDGEPSAYGFGWFLDPWKGHERMWHYGETIGFRTAIQRFPRDGLTVVVLANRSDFKAGPTALQAAGIYLDGR